MWLTTTIKFGNSWPEVAAAYFLQLTRAAADIPNIILQIAASLQAVRAEADPRKRPGRRRSLRFGSPRLRPASR